MAESTPEFFRGVAAVPHRRASSSLDADTGEMPMVEAAAPATYGPGRSGDTWSGAGRLGGRAGPSPRGMVVRRRWRSLRAGGEWTITGLMFALVCWAIWTLSIRGNDLLDPVLWLILVLATGASVFVMARLLGRVVLERALGRRRRTAWPSHLVTGAFLTAAGIGFLRRTQWVIDAWTWVASYLP